MGVSGRSSTGGQRTWGLRSKDSAHLEQRRYSLVRKEAGEDFGELRVAVGLSEDGAFAVIAAEAGIAVAGREDERDALRGERVGDGMAGLPIKVNIEHGDVEVPRAD